MIVGAEVIEKIELFIGLTAREMTKEEKTNLELNPYHCVIIIEALWEQETSSGMSNKDEDWHVSSGQTPREAIGSFIDDVGEGAVQFYRADQDLNRDYFLILDSLGLKPIIRSGFQMEIVEM